MFRDGFFPHRGPTFSILWRQAICSMKLNKILETVPVTEWSGVIHYLVQHSNSWSFSSVVSRSSLSLSPAPCFLPPASPSSFRSLSFCFECCQTHTRGALIHKHPAIITAIPLPHSSRVCLGSLFLCSSFTVPFSLANSIHILFSYVHLS